MSEKYAYFVAAGRSEDALDQINADWLAARDAAIALRDRFGAEAIVSSDGGQGPILGFTFAGDPPEGWRKRGEIQSDPFYMPGRRSKALRAIYDEIVAARYCPSTRINYAFVSEPMGVWTGEPHPRGHGVIVRSATLETIGDKRIIGIPLVKGELTVAPPADARPLKLSEYYALKEAEAQAG